MQIQLSIRLIFDVMHYSKILTLKSSNISLKNIQHVTAGNKQIGKHVLRHKFVQESNLQNV